jgi:hypothetical protein
MAQQVSGAPSSLNSGQVATNGSSAVKIVDARPTRTKLFLRFPAASVGIGDSAITPGDTGGAYYHTTNTLELETAAEVWCVQLDGAAPTEFVRFLELYD